MSDWINKEGILLVEESIVCQTLSAMCLYVPFFTLCFSPPRLQTEGGNGYFHDCVLTGVEMSGRNAFWLFAP